MFLLREYLHHLRLFSRNSRLYLAGTFFFGFGFGTFWVLLNLYLRAIGLSDTLIDRRGFTLPMLVTVGLYLGSSFLYYAFFRDTERRMLIGSAARQAAGDAE